MAFELYGYQQDLVDRVLVEMAVGCDLKDLAGELPQSKTGCL